MSSHRQKMIFFALIVTIVIPISAAHRRRRSDETNLDNTEQYLKHLCFETDNSDVCWKIVRSELHQFHDGSDERGIVSRVIELAMAKSEEIRDQLKKWYKDSNDNKLKEKYDSCSSNYNDVDRDLQEMQRNLDSNDYLKILKQMKDAEHELDECKRKFGPGSFDPGHVRDRNNELEIYLDLVRAATHHLRDYYDDYYRRQK